MNNTLASFYQGKRVFITGHTGFKGPWLAMWLNELGAHVTGYALPPDGEHHLHGLAAADAGISLYADVTDLDALREALEDSGAEIVFHMAAQSLVRPSYARPVETYRTNIMGTVHLLEAVRGLGGRVRAVVNVTSDKCYRNDESDRPFVEDDPLGGHDPYSSSKGAAEIVTAAYRHSFFLDGPTAVATARAGNVIGGGDFSVDRIIPDIIRAVMAGAPVKIRNPRSVRPWQHVLDGLSGYLLLARRLYEQGGAFARSYNFGPDDERVVTVGELVKRLIGVLGQGDYVFESEAGAPFESGMLRLDSSLARRDLQWRPVFDVEAAIAYTAEWYRAFLDDRAHIRDFTRDQIRRYNERL